MRTVAALLGVLGFPLALGGVVLLGQALWSAAAGHDAAAAGSHLVAALRLLTVGGLLSAPLFYVQRHDR